MPLPKPNSGEGKDEFLERCMSNEAMIDEYPDEDQRYAVCNTQWGKKDMDETIEKRAFEVSELRIDKAADRQKIVGHAAVFDVVAGEGMWFRERIAPGAFAESIMRDDIRALLNHDPNHVLGRNKSGTLTLREDEKGLLVEIDPPDTQVGRDLMQLIARGDISQMSFGFETLIDEWERNEDGPDLRTLKKVKLWDVSPVTFPFYTQTDVALRSHKNWQNSNKVAPIRRMQRKLNKNRRSL